MAASLKLLPYCSMAWPTLLDCRLRELRRNHCATAGQAQTRTYPGQRSSTGSCVPYRFRLDTGPCVGTGGGLAKSGKEIQDSKDAPQHGQLGANVRSELPMLRSLKKALAHNPCRIPARS